MQTDKKKHSIIRLAGSLLFALIVLLAATLMIPSADGLPVSGFGFYAVLTQSMSPTINAGSLIVVHRTAPEGIETGDIITYRIREGSETFVTHRVVKIESGDVGLQFITRGDANNTDDLSPVASGQLLGKTVFWISGLGFLTTNFRPFLIFVLVALILLWSGFNLLHGRNKNNSAPEQPS